MTRPGSRSDGRGRSPSESEREGETDDESPLEDVVTGITIGLILTVAFGLLALGVPWFWIVFPIGFAGVLPAVLGLTKLYERRRSRREANRVERGENAIDDGTRSRDALETLRERYARGELTDTAFERRLERLVATETLEDAQREVRARTRGRESHDRVDSNLDHDRDHDDHGHSHERDPERDENVELEGS